MTNLIVELSTFPKALKNQSVNTVYGNNGCFSAIHTEHINTPCGHKINFLNVKPDGT